MVDLVHPTKRYWRWNLFRLLSRTVVEATKIGQRVKRKRKRKFLLLWCMKRTTTTTKLDLPQEGYQCQGKNDRHRDDGWKCTRCEDLHRRFAGFHYRDGRPKYIIVSRYIFINKCDQQTSINSLCLIPCSSIKRLKIKINNMWLPSQRWGCVQVYAWVWAVWLLWRPN